MMVQHVVCNVHGCTRYAKVTGRCLHHSLHSKTALPSIAGLLNPQSTSCIVVSTSKSTNFDVDPQKNPRMCRVANCTSYARRQGRCSRHGGSIICCVDGCGTPAQTGGKCRAHGGGTMCKVMGCKAFARVQGLCSHHRTNLVGSPA